MSKKDDYGMFRTMLVTQSSFYQMWQNLSRLCKIDSATKAENLKFISLSVDKLDGL